MICFAAKWVGSDDEPVFFSDFHHGHGVMVSIAAQLLEEADAILTYNGDYFDEPRINREILAAGVNPPSPYKRIDLYKVVKKRFAFPSGKLDYVCRELGIGAKTEHSGFDLWKRCMSDDPQAWSLMREYNMNDVALNERLYFRLLPWIPGLPSYGAESGSDVCPACGSDQLVRQGHAYTKTGRYQRYTCSSCHTWSRASRRDAHTEIVQTA